MLYVDADTIRAFAEADDASPINVWNILAASASRVFDRACDVPDNFFAKASDTPTEKTFFLDATGFVELLPFVGEIAVADENNIAISTENYELRDNFLVFKPETIIGFTYSVVPRKIRVSAKWGFADVPADVAQAVIEQAIFMWRRKDAAFADISGVSAAVVQQNLSATCQLVAAKYKEKYLQIGV